MNQIQGAYASQAKALVGQWRSIVATSVDTTMSQHSPRSVVSASSSQGLPSVAACSRMNAVRAAAGQQALAAIGRIKKALDVAARTHDVETVRSLLSALVPFVMTEDMLRQTGAPHTARGHVHAAQALAWWWAS